MWEPRRLTTLRAFTASYRDSVTFIIIIIIIILVVYLTTVHVSQTIHRRMKELEGVQSRYSFPAEWRRTAVILGFGPGLDPCRRKRSWWLKLNCCPAIPPLWSSSQSSWLQIQRSRVRFLGLPDFLRSSGSGTGSTQPREDN
jgi:hypothetical protein